MEKDKVKRPLSTQAKDIAKVVRDIFSVTPLITIYVIVAVILFAVNPFIVSLLTGLAIDELAQAEGSGINVIPNTLILIAAGYIFISIFNQLNNALYNYVDRLQYQKLNTHFTLSFIQKASELDLYHYEDSSKNDLIQRAKDAYQWRPQNIFANTLWSINQIVAVVTSIGVVAVFSWPLVVILIATSLPTLIVNIQYADKAYGIWGATKETQRRFYAAKSYLEDENSLMELRIFGTKGYLFNIVKDTFTNYFGSEQKAVRQLTLYDSLSGVIAEIGIIIIFIASIVAVLNGNVTVGLFTFYVTSAGRFSTSLSSLFRKLTRLRSDANYIHDYYEFMALENTIQPGTQKLNIRDNQPPRVEFKHVDFRYPDTDTPVLTNFELTIEPGERIAFVGENGAGKTTIIKLLSRFYDVSSGQILINGVDIRDYEISEWYNQIGVLFQDFTKYDFLPVKSSIGVGDINKIDNLEEVVKSAQKSGADEFIREFSTKYNQILSKRFPGGTDLSGGQWQRVALARAFFRDAPILILDEPTSAIDPKGEAEIFEKLYEFSAGKTVIIISHRFSTVRQADKIYVVEQGKIVEAGSHEQLMDLNGKYKEAFETQAKGYQ